MSPSRPGSSIIAGADDQYLWLLHYILYERISGPLSFLEFLLSHERVVDLPVDCLFAREEGCCSRGAPEDWGGELTLSFTDKNNILRYPEYATSN